MMDSLRRVAAAAETIEQATSQLRDAVTAAYLAGATVADVAAAADVTRQTVYRWLVSTREGK